MAKSILCVSWDPALASTREWLLTRAGFQVTSALGRDQAAERCRSKADLLVLGHSVPREDKSSVIQCFRKFSAAPVLSLLRPGQPKLPEADYGVDASNPQDFLETVSSVLGAPE
jgi:DNA-binding response OmpR family regulator